MKADEFKLRVTNKVNCLIDQYFTRDTVFERFMNATLKIIYKNNMYKVGSFLELFQDENGDIDTDRLVNEYAEQLGDESINLNLRDYVHDENIKNVLPDRTLVITRDDLYDIISETAEL